MIVDGIAGKTVRGMCLGFNANLAVVFEDGQAVAFEAKDRWGDDVDIDECDFDPLDFYADDMDALGVMTLAEREQAMERKRKAEEAEQEGRELAALERLERKYRGGCDPK